MATLAELSFGKRIQPEEVSLNVRCDLAHDEWQREWTWVGLFAVFGVAVALGFSLAYRWHGDPFGAEVPAILFVGLAAVIAMAAVHAIFNRRRAFLMNMPATRALVLTVEPTYKYTDDSGAHQKRLKLRYLPKLGAYGDDLELLIGDNTAEVITDLSPQSEMFASSLDKGALVSLLYDPRQPDHIRVIERLVEHHTAPAAA